MAIEYLFGQKERNFYQRNVLSRLRIHNIKINYGKVIDFSLFIVFNFWNT